MDRGAWRAMVHEVAESRTRLQGLSTHGTHVNSMGIGTLFVLFTHIPPAFIVVPCA